MFKGRGVRKVENAALEDQDSEKGKRQERRARREGDRTNEQAEC